MTARDLRKEYMLHGLSETDLDPDPFTQFRAWFEAAIQANLIEPNAMTLATATPNGQPSARMVLLKDIEPNGFVFFSNYESRKGHELAENPRVALVFFWVELERQVRIEGRVEPLAPEDSDAYFQSRPYPSQLGAWASRQSQVIPTRAVLEERMQALAATYPQEHVPRPPYWGGYRVVPSVIEFWQGRSGRLHDRLRYQRLDDGPWRIERLSP